MKARSTICKAICILSVIVSSSANAETLNKYAQLNVGYAQGMSPKGDFKRGSFKKSEIYGAEFGCKINDHLRASLSADYRAGFSNKYWMNDPFYDNDYTTSRIKVRALAVLANINYDITTIGKFTPYITAGVGVAKVISEPREVNVHEGRYTTTGVTRRATRTNLAYKVGTGAVIELSEKFSLDLRYQFVNLGKFRTSREEKIYDDGVFVESVLSDKERGKLRSHEFMVGLSYKF